MVLMELCGTNDATGNARWNIFQYTDDVLLAITRAFGMVGKVLTVLTSRNEYKYICNER